MRLATHDHQFFFLQSTFFQYGFYSCADASTHLLLFNKISWRRWLRILFWIRMVEISGIFDMIKKKSSNILQKRSMLTVRNSGELAHQSARTKESFSIALYSTKIACLVLGQTSLPMTVNTFSKFNRQNSGNWKRNKLRILPSTWFKG